MDMIFLHGRAAVGKLTVAKVLAAQIGFALFHNHLIVDAVLAVFPFGSEPFVRLRHEFWLKTFAEAAREKRSLIFTFAPERSVPGSFVPETIQTIERHGGRMCFVGLVCTPEEQSRRIENPDRKQFQKLASREALRQIDAEGKGFGVIPPSDLTLDTTNARPEETARRIIEHFDLDGPPG
jgi:hypothetical protein